MTGVSEPAVEFLIVDAGSGAFADTVAVAVADWVADAVVDAVAGTAADAAFPDDSSFVSGNIEIEANFATSANVLTNP